jgi:hypothetical protein
MHHDKDDHKHSKRRVHPSKMTTNRPFFANFFAAFRAQSAIQKAATSQASAGTAAYSHTTTAATATATTTSSHNTPSTTRTLASKAGPPSPGPTSTAMQTTSQFQPTRQHAAPYHRSTSPAAAAFPIPGSARRDRRGSDSSSEGFREVIGADKWYIGGRTATGEEKFYKLAMVKRHRSVDRLSLDRLSI